ncbi:MAG: hypothetical protein ACTSUR_02405 [Candidatus Heimdallarchaeaceae archaeon]
MIINKKIGIQVEILIAVILLSSYVYAFAVSTPYWKDNPLIISPGETKDFKLTLLNTAGSENISVKGVISEGSEIAEITDTETTYIVPAGGRTEVNMRVTIPSDANMGGSYNVKVTFTTITEGKAGTFGLGSSIEQGFDVIVSEKKKVESAGVPEVPATTSMVYWILALIVVIVVVAFLIIRKKHGLKPKPQ